MSEPRRPDTPPSDGELQFDKAEVVDAVQSPAAPAARPGCSRCGHAFTDEYFGIDDTFVCPTCVRWFKDAPDGGALGRTARAMGYGAFAAVVGAGIYFAVRAITGFEFGFIGILVGFIVGKAVRAGSGGRGGTPYQALAVVITYLAITSTYVPLVLRELANHPSQNAVDEGPGAVPPDASPSALPPAVAPPAGSTAVKPAAAAPQPPLTLGGFVVAIVVLVAMALVLPFLGGFSNFMGWIIIGISLWEAWKFARPPTITGPFRVAPAEPEATTNG